MLFLKDPMKKFLSLMLLAGAFASANNAVACSLNERTSPDVREVVVANGGWPISDEKCAFLAKHNLRLSVSAMSTVLSGVSVGWASVRITNNNNVGSDTSQVSTNTNSSPGMDIANNLMYSSIKAATAALDVELAAKQIGQYEKAIKVR